MFYDNKSLDLNHYLFSFTKWLDALKVLSKKIIITMHALDFLFNKDMKAKHLNS